ncbi:TonB-dependent receptor [Dyella terrae]|uniref:TonB-dependent receptor n=1 Tax=Dyella terrae TaxID=522259 RepID=UPI001EFE49D2|nr:TonB-dependent receptor [Dyella terrae]ULU25904.1 TonB-dependent receptor [Dyella terrae]
MSHRKTLLAASIIAGLCLSGSLYAQTAAPATGPAPQSQSSDQAPDQSKAKDLETVTVTGIRASLQASMDTKRNADAIVDAITSEDIGKFPASNVAEALAQIPGVTLDRQLGATQRVSINGMDPSLNLTLLDGHPVAQAVWLYDDAPNRGFNYSLLAPEVIGRLEIYKSPEARLPEGALGGTIIMHTVKPLDVPSNTVSGSFGVNYNDMVKDSRPSGSLFYSWHNDDKTFGVDVSAQHYEQFQNRQGLENYGYTPVSGIVSKSPVAAAEVAAGKIKLSDQIPNQISVSNFQQTEKRDSVTSNVQWKPTEALSFNLGLMYARDNLSNLNQSLYPWALHNPAGITSLNEGPNGIITSGSQAGTPCKNNLNCVSTADTYADNNARKSVITTKGVDLSGEYKGDGWRLDGQAGVSTSRNPMQAAVKEIYYGGGFNWSINQGPQYTDPSTANDPSYWADNGWGGNIGKELYKAKDTYGQLDFTKDFDGFLNNIQAGVRYAKHWESQTLNVYTGPQALTLDQIGFGGLSDLNGAKSLGLSQTAIQHVQTAGANAIFNAINSTPGFGSTQDPNSYWDNTWATTQENEAAYLQANFGTDNVHGNLGVRYVHTKNVSSGWVIPAPCAAADVWNCDFPSGFGYITQDSTHNNWLPSFNIAWNLTPDVILRGAGSETLSYAPYNQMAPYFAANDTVLTAAAGNPNIKPYRSVNFDGSAEWYFNPESMVAVSFFYKHVLNYIVNAATTEERQNGSWTQPGFANNAAALVASGACTTTGLCSYDVTAPVDGGSAKVKGGTISYQQAYGYGFGLRANYTYSDASTKTGGALPYNSKNSYTVAPYYEQGPYSASLAYTYRSSYLAGGYVAGAPSTYIDGFKELDATLGYEINKNFSLSLNMLNLLNSKYYAYLGSKTQMSSEYVTGRQYMLKANFKF